MLGWAWSYKPTVTTDLPVLDNKVKKMLDFFSQSFVFCTSDHDATSDWWGGAVTWASSRAGENRLNIGVH
jgi:hypothetical protein